MTCSLILQPEEDIDLFSEPTTEDIDYKKQRVERRVEIGRQLHDSLPANYMDRTSAENRRLYVLDTEKRHEIQVFKNVWTVEECNKVMAAVLETVKLRGGWHTTRHEAHPTTDIPCSEVTSMDKWIRQSLFEKVITPSAHFRGFRPEQLFFSDLFFVKYEVAENGDSTQSELGIHTDGSVLSFNVLLNPADEFEGGGTYFVHLDKAVQIEQGDCAVHDGKIEHAGAKVTKGKRIILVAFVENVKE